MYLIVINGAPTEQEPTGNLRTIRCDEADLDDVPGKDLTTQLINWAIEDGRFDINAQLIPGDRIYGVALTDPKVIVPEIKDYTPPEPADDDVGTSEP